MTGVLPAQAPPPAPQNPQAAPQTPPGVGRPGWAGAARRDGPGRPGAPAGGQAGGSRRPRRPRTGAHQARPGPRHDEGLPPRLDVRRSGHVLESRERIRRLGHGNQDRHGMGHQEGQLPGRRPLAPLLRCHRAGQLHRELEPGRRAEAGAPLVRPRRRQGAGRGARLARRELRLAGIRRDGRRLVPGAPLGHVRRAGDRRGSDLPGDAALPQVPQAVRRDVLAETVVARQGQRADAHGRDASSTT